MILGIIQGRLLKPVGNHIQEFPDNWRHEFTLLEEAGLSHIEWLITRSSFDSNPIFFEDCGKYKISSLCADTLVDKEFTSEYFLSENLDPICKAAIKNKIEWITIPLLEESSISDKKVRKSYISRILKYADKYPLLNFSFEAETPWQNIMELVSLRDNFWITYDTGNITSERLNHEEYILNTFQKISNVHLKDRTFNAQTVPPLSGDTDFDSIFNTLEKVGYNRKYTLQTARGQTGFEERTIRQHKNIFERIYNEKSA
mgnify:FL=1